MRGDFESTIKDAVNAVKNGLVEKNTKKYILDAIKESGYKSDEVYLYAVLPRKAIEGNGEVKAMLERVWNKILESKPLKNGFGRVVHMDRATLNKIKSILRDGSLSKEEKLEKIRNILKDLKYNGRNEFGRGKGIFRVEDIHSDSVEGVMSELRIEGSAEGRVIIELKTNDNPEIFMPEQHYKIVEERWHWPYTGTGFISSREGEILPDTT